MAQQTSHAQPIPAQMLYDAVLAAGVTDVVAVPDTHVRSLIALMRSRDDMRFIQTATEDEAITLAAGLIVGGRTPLIQIQHAGLYACINHLRGVAIDGEFPMLFMIGLLNRDPSKAPRDHLDSMVRYTEPLLDVFDVPYYLLDGPEDVGQIEVAMRQAQERRGPVAVLIGEQTA
ncbi:MAG: thiamine pyrophosphate-binding protein [Chloroflexi bacterium]|nr:thiamine pyrophosphate-binding protein [Chloroflexota bacterium]MDA1241004.1 thiamine pyrophosphate-binding protein [Chloroflexota bacterium]